MNWILFLELSGIIFWLMWIVIGLYYLYDKIETEYFIWNHKRKWTKYYNNLKSKDHD